jgi:hydroxyacylglutathione hydrolase
MHCGMTAKLLALRPMTTTNVNDQAQVQQPPLEDQWNDVLSKAMKGTGIDDKNLAASANLIPAKLKTILQGERPSEDALRRLAVAVGIRPKPLIDLAMNRYHPKPFQAGKWPGLLQISTDYMAYLVNCYLIWDTSTREAVLFDTGTSLEAVRERVDQHQLKLTQIFITHGHGDHVAVLEELRETYRPQVLGPSGEGIAGNFKEINDGYECKFGSIELRARLTEGHSPAHLSYVLSSPQWPAPVAVVGDTLFAGSMGGGNHSYPKLRENVQDKILTLAGATLVCPGHGPCTTVEEECLHNPFA